jgi:hypothetical protein
MVTDSLQFMTGCRIKAALASAEAIGSAIDRYYGTETDDQEELDFALEDLVEPSVQTAARLNPPNPAVHSDGLSATALKQLENRYENLVRILLDRGLIDYKDLDELM